MTESEEGREGRRWLTPNNPFKNNNIGVVFKDFRFEFRSTDPNHPPGFCPYGNHRLLIKDDINANSFFDVHIDFIETSYFPESPVLMLSKQVCQKCNGLIEAIILPLPPYREWTHENWLQFYTDLLGTWNMTREKRFEPLMHYIHMRFPNAEMKKVFDKVDRIMAGEETID